MLSIPNSHIIFSRDTWLLNFLNLFSGRLPVVTVGKFIKVSAYKMKMRELRYCEISFDKYYHK